MHWPQWTVLILTLVDLGYIIAKDGEPKGKYNAVYSLIDASIVLWLLWCGGFFS